MNAPCVALDFMFYIVLSPILIPFSGFCIEQQSLEEGENTNALARVKTTSTMASSTTTTMMASTLGRVVGQRAVLGDRGNFRAPSGAQTLRSAKADAFDAGEFRKPALAPVSRTAPHKKAAAPPPPPPAEDLASQLKST